MKEKKEPIVKNYQYEGNCHGFIEAHLRMVAEGKRPSNKVDLNWEWREKTNLSVKSDG